MLPRIFTRHSGPRMGGQVSFDFLYRAAPRPPSESKIKNEPRVAHRTSTEPRRRHVRFLEMTLYPIQQLHGLSRLTQDLCSCFVLSRKVPSSLGDFLQSSDRQKELDDGTCQRGA